MNYLSAAVLLAGLFIACGLFFGLRTIAQALPISLGKISNAIVTLSNKP